MKNKEVRFCLEKNKVHTLFVWSFACRAVRKPYWMFIAIDRYRFMHRIKSVSRILDPILTAKHRETVFNQRFINSTQ